MWQPMTLYPVVTYDMQQQITITLYSEEYIMYMQWLYCVHEAANNNSTACSNILYVVGMLW